MHEAERKRRLLVHEGLSVTRTAREYGISVRILILIIIEPRKNQEESYREGEEEERRNRRNRRMSS